MGLSPGRTLLGLYEGIPLTERSHAYHLVTPDLITLFQGPIETAASEGETADGLSFEARVAEQIRHTTIHEIAHHFGISDDRLRELGVY